LQGALSKDGVHKVEKDLSRVTRLGEFSPIGWLFTWGRLFENYSSSQNSLFIYFRGKIYVLILTTRTGWVIFRAIISPMHLVTLDLS
jgi:hypothetical protein